MKGTGTMAKLVIFRENVIQFYQKHEAVVRTVLKFVLSFVILFALGRMFDFGSKANNPVLYAVISLAQAFLPAAVIYFTGSLLIMLNLSQLSPDILAGFVLLFLIGCLTLVRVDRKSAWIAMAVPVLFYLKLEYIIPVLLGITVGWWAVVPSSMGILIYFLSGYTESVSTLLTTTEAAGPAAGLQRIASLIVIDNYLLVIFATYCTVILITALLNRLFYERAWFFAIVVGNAVLAVLLLCGRYMFELDYEVWLVFLEVAVSILLCLTYWFFRGIGDASRTERTVFEDDEYIYYVKAVPKIKITQRDHNVRDINTEGDKPHPEEKKAFEFPPDLAAGKDKKPAGAEGDDPAVETVRKPAGAEGDDPAVKADREAAGTEGTGPSGEEGKMPAEKAGSTSRRKRGKKSPKKKKPVSGDHDETDQSGAGDSKPVKD